MPAAAIQRCLIATVTAVCLVLTLVLPAGAQEAGPSAQPSALPPPVVAPSASPALMFLAGTWDVLAFDAWTDGLVEPREADRFTVHFLPVARFEGETGCGRYFGRYTLDGERLGMRVVSKGPDPCDVPTTEEAAAFSVALDAVATWSEVEGGVELRDADGRVRALLQRAEQVGLPGTWNVARYYRPNGRPVEPLADRPIVVTFEEDGLMRGSTGCRLFDGFYVAQTDQVIIAPIDTAGLPCEGDARRQERRLQSIFEQVVLWQRSGDRLVLTDGAGTPLLELRVSPGPAEVADATPTIEPGG